MDHMKTSKFFVYRWRIGVGAVPVMTLVLEQRALGKEPGISWYLGMKQDNELADQFEWVK